AVEVGNIHQDQVPSKSYLIPSRESKSQTDDGLNQRLGTCQTWTLSFFKWVTVVFLFMLIIYKVFQHQFSELYRYLNEERQRKLHEEMEQQKLLEAQRQFEEAKKGIYFFTIFFSAIYLCFKQPLALIVIIVLSFKLYF